MGNLLRDTTRPNWLPPSSPEIIKDPDGIPDAALAPMEDVYFGVQPWIFSEDLYLASIPETVELLPNEERVPWTDDGSLPQNAGSL